eukprot:Rhum_TRINITY_DN13629_c0_g4::Rhum_TRINITY_DN13629_c0_g4_i1::g.62149::m.62149
MDDERRSAKRAFVAFVEGEDPAASGDDGAKTQTSAAAAAAAAPAAATAPPPAKKKKTDDVAAAAPAPAPAPQPQKRPLPPPAIRYQPGWWVGAYPNAVSLPSLPPSFLPDCRTAFRKKSFWVEWDEASPRCVFERFALDVFREHYGRAGLRRAPPPGSGAEWWVQVRGTAAEAGREESLGFHWDRDEEEAVATGGRTVTCPNFGTVTYLTAVGAPTVVVPVSPVKATGKHPFSSVYVSHPSPGKHIVFRGDALHGCPPEMMRKAPAGAGAGAGGKGYTRITLLVNVWIGYHPQQIEAAPAELIAQLKTPASTRVFQAGGGGEGGLAAVQAGSSCQVGGFQFGRRGVEDHEVWLPTPPRKANAANSTFCMSCPPQCKVLRLSK